MVWIDRYENPLNRFDTQVPWVPNPSISTTAQWPFRPGVERILRRAHITARRRVHGWGEFAQEAYDAELMARLLPKLLIPAPKVYLDEASVAVTRRWTSEKRGPSWEIKITMETEFMEMLFVPPYDRGTELMASLDGGTMAVQLSTMCTSRHEAEVVAQMWLEELEATMHVIACDHDEFVRRLPATIENAITTARGWLRVGYYATTIRRRLD